MPWTSHGYWTGLREPTYPGPLRLDCGGPHRCMQCAVEAHRLEAEIAMTTPSYTFDEPVQFSVEVTATGAASDTIVVRLHGSAVDADSLTQTIAHGITTALASAHTPVPSST